MNRFSKRALRVVCVSAAIWLSITAATAQTATSRMVSAANKFLATLSEQQRKSVLYAFGDDEQRARWSNLPTTIVPRGGISLKEMNATQRSAAMALVSSALSPRGLEKVQQIMQGDEVLKVGEAKNGNRPPRGNGGPRPGGPGGGAMFGKDLYYISILGTPSEKSPWMLQFGGHHLALNITVAGERGALTPTLTGTQPALYISGGKTVRPLGLESDKALALLHALDDSERKQAVLSYRLADLVLGPGQDGKTIVPEGLKASGMTEQQRAMLLDVISEWAGIIHESAAAARMAQLKADINETWFSWSGPTTAAPGKNITAYYRIQGPHLVIEYAPQTLGGDPALHVHTMYRDPTNDYGRGLIKE
ncbi:MAG TPA: DUF3500 domain-containing protein [Acidobacteriaceae bacterium]|jgi:hypothetical protein|nr:DUF3500 domain-containing protein [Acidobacteriaceae bacterium]